MKYPVLRPVIAALAISAMLIAIPIQKAGAGLLISESSSFGPNTITLDTATGLRWLDVTLSTPYSYDEILVELGPGGEFEGFRLATQAEVLTFWQDAGIDTGTLGQFTSANFQPIVDLMALVGVTGPNSGNLGGGNFFDFTAGHIDSSVPPSPDWVWVATLSADPDPTVTGRPGFGSVPSDNLNNQHGSWLITLGRIIRVPGDYLTIQAAIDAASDGDTVLVADGSYTGEGNKNLDFHGKAITVQSENGPENCIIDCEGDGRGFYFHSFEGEESVVSGFTIRNGYVENYPDNRGGGIYCYTSSPTITNCTFSGNRAEYGGGMYNDSSSPNVTNCTFSGNEAIGVAGRGGGMYNYSSSPNVTNCTFSGNEAIGVAGRGGGMYNNSSSPMVTNSTFSLNEASNGGGMYNTTTIISVSWPTVTHCTFLSNQASVHGGGMGNDSCRPMVTDCTFLGNQAGGSGGGMYNFTCWPTVANCTFSDNQANSGGGIGNSISSSPTVSDCIFSGNQADIQGGGMSNYSHSWPTVTNCTFSGNKASGYRYGGGGMSNDRYCSPMVTNCTFSGNEAIGINGRGGGMYNEHLSSPTVTNCILWNDSPEEIYNYDSELSPSVPVVTFCDVQGGYSGEGNIDADPFFVDVSDPDPANWDMHLRSFSPCIDAGTDSVVLPDSDFEGDPRIIDGDSDGTAIVDMGADEYWEFRPMMRVTATIDLGVAIPYEFEIREKHFKVLLDWRGSKLKLSVYAPDGSLYHEEESQDPPIIIDVLNPQGSKWKFVVTGVEIPDIPEPFSLVVYTLAVVPSAIDIDPNTLNLKSKGKWITCYIELLDYYEVEDINVGTVLLENMIPAEASPTEIGDSDLNGIPDLMVKFDRQALIEYLDGTTGEVTLMVTGEVGGTSFEGSDTIRVIEKGKRKGKK